MEGKDIKEQRKLKRLERKAKREAALKAKLDITPKADVKLTKSGRVSKRKQKVKRLPEWYKPQFKVNAKVEFKWLNQPMVGRVESIDREEPKGFAKEGRVLYMVRKEGGLVYPIGYMGSSSNGDITRKVPRKKKQNS